MKTKKNAYKAYVNMKVGIFAHEEANMRTLHGKLLLNAEESHVLFIQYPPRGPRSVELLRTAHSRLVQRPDGNYTLTFRFSPREKEFPVMLAREMGEIATNPVFDK